MLDVNTTEFAIQLRAAINHAITAHQENPKSLKSAIRYWDKRTPYVIHPIWSAMTLLTETTLPADIRYSGYLVLLWHDILEDTNLALPEDAPPEVVSLVQEMTFDSFEQETQLLWARSDGAKLLKLYDKVSNLLDGTWQKPIGWNKYVKHTEKLIDWVEKMHGELNIVKIARAVCKYKAIPISDERT